jgi:DNA-binding transcriptional LysR family regulator
MSKAAAELHVSQPAVSDAIKSLEKELGVRLFYRVKNRVHLTEAGEYYLEQALAKEKFILFHKDFLQNRVVNEAFHSCGLEPDVLLETGQLHTIIAFVRQGIAASFLFTEVAKTLPGVVSLHLDPRPWRCTWSWPGSPAAPSTGT